jgi:hypothetical protein
MTKTEITQALKSLENYGWTVKTFNSNRKTSRGMIGFPDHFLMNPYKRKLVMIEVKLGKDILTVDQRYFINTAEETFRASKNEIMIFPGKYKTIPELLDYLFNC